MYHCQGAIWFDQDPRTKCEQRSIDVCPDGTDAHLSKSATEADELKMPLHTTSPHCTAMGRVVIHAMDFLMMSILVMGGRLKQLQGREAHSWRSGVFRASIYRIDVAP